MANSADKVQHFGPVGLMWKGELIYRNWKKDNGYQVVCMQQVVGCLKVYETLIREAGYTNNNNLYIYFTNSITLHYIIMTQNYHYCYLLLCYYYYLQQKSFGLMGKETVTLRYTYLSITPKDTYDTRYRVGVTEEQIIYAELYKCLPTYLCFSLSNIQIGQNSTKI